MTNDIKSLLGSLGVTKEEDKLSKSLQREASQIEKNLIDAISKGLDFSQLKGDLGQLFGKKQIPELAGKFQAKFVEKVNKNLIAWERNQAKLLEQGFTKQASAFPSSLTTGGAYEKEFAKFTQLNADTANLWSKYSDLLQTTNKGLSQASKATKAATGGVTASKTNLAHIFGGTPIIGGAAVGGLFGGPIGAIAGGGIMAALLHGRFGQHLANVGRAGAGFAGMFGGAGGGAGGIGGAGGGGLGAGMMGGMAAFAGPAALLAMGVAGVGYELYKVGQEKISSRNKTLESLNRAGRVLGMRWPIAGMTAGMSYGMPTPAKGNLPLVNPELQRLGLMGPEDIASTALAYGMGPGSNRATILSAALANNMKYMGFQSKEEWANYLGKIASMGMAGGAGLTAVVGTLSKSVESGVRAGIRPEDTYDAVNKIMGALIAGGAGAASFTTANRMAAIGRFSDIPGMRTGAIQAQAAAQAQSDFQNILGTPMLFAQSAASFRQATGSNRMDSGDKINRWLKSMGVAPHKFTPAQEQYLRDAGGNIADVLPFLASIGVDASMYAGPLQYKSWETVGKSLGYTGRKLNDFTIRAALRTLPPSERTMMLGAHGLLGRGGVPGDVKDLATAMTEAYKGGRLPTVEEELATSREAVGSDVNKSLALEKAAADDLTASFIKLNDAITATTVKFNNAGTPGDWLPNMITGLAGGLIPEIGTPGYPGGGAPGGGAGFPGATMHDKVVNLIKRYSGMPFTP
jgi:hypothetical protein